MYITFYITLYKKSPSDSSIERDFPNSLEMCRIFFDSLYLGSMPP